MIRVLKGESSLLRSLVWFLAVFISASHIAQTVFLFLQCKPLDALWYASMEDIKCFTHEQLSLVYYIGYSLDALTDLLCASVPVAIIFRLQLSNNTRIGLYILMGLGTLIAGCALVKTITISGAWARDYTWESAVPTWFTIAEYYGAVVLASAPSLSGLLAPKGKSNPTLYGVQGARNGSLHNMPRKGSAWTLATPKLPGIAKKHFSISTFGISEGAEGSRLTLVDNRLTVVEEDEDRLICVAEEGNDDLERATLDNQSVRTATLKGGQFGWNKEDVFGLGILGKDDLFGREGSVRTRADTCASSIYSVGRPTRPSTPKRMTISTRPTTPKVASRPSSRPGTPKSPGFTRMPGTPKMPGTPRTRFSVASSIYSDPPASAGLPTIPSPPASAKILPLVIKSSSKPTTPKTPKTPAWTALPSGFTTPKGSGTPTRYGANTPTGPGSRTPKGSSTPGGGSRPGTPKQSMSAAVPMSKFRAEISEEVAAEVKRVGKFSNLGMEKSKALPQPPLELRVIDIPAPAKFDPHDSSY